MRYISPYNILLLASLIACVFAYLQELKRLKYFVVAFGLFIVACLAGCADNRIQGSVATKYGKFSYDSKTMLPPEPAASPAPEKRWWQF